MTTTASRRPAAGTTLTPLEVALQTGPPMPADAAEDCDACLRQLGDDLPATSRRSQKEIARVLTLLDQLETERTEA